MFRSRRWWQNYTAIALSVVLVVALPLMVVGITQVQRFTNQASSLQLEAESQLVRLQVQKPDNVTLNTPQEVVFTIPQAATYNALQLSVDPRYLKNVTIKTSADWRWQKQFTDEQKSTYAFTSVNLKNKDSLLTKADMISPVKCFPQICPGERQITSAKQDLRVSVTFTPYVAWTATQRPLMVTAYALLTSGDQALYDELEMRPELALTTVVPNRVPVIASLPPRASNSTSAYEYEVKAADADGDALFYTTSCPDFINCIPHSDSLIGQWTLQGSTLQWSQPQGRAIPYQVSVYVTDGKAVAEQTYSLAVFSPTEPLAPVCEQFRTEYPVTILSDQDPTNMFLVAQDAVGVSSVQIDFTNISVSGSVEQSLRWNFTTPKPEVVLDKNSQPSLKYQFRTGEYRVAATITNSSGKSVTCPLQVATPNIPATIQSSRSVWSRFTTWLLTPALAQSSSIPAGSNTAPQFTTDPYKESNVNMKVNEEYKYVLKVTDTNRDQLSYVTVTKPSWSSVAVTQGNGDLTLTITGKPTKNGSNTFSFSVSDGYASHWVTQTWLVNVEDPNNDTPKITITKPTAPVSLKQGDNLAVTWDAQDKQQIIRFDVYVTTNPDKPQDGVVRLTNLKYNVRSVNMSTKSIPVGKYYVVVTGTDTFKTPATGKAVSPLITITDQSGSNGGNGENPSTEVPYPNPVVTNVNPADQSTVRTRTPIISATVKSSTNATLDAKKITIKVDDKEVTTSAQITGDGKTEGTVVYTPPTFLELGKRSVTITVTDSSGKATTHTWTFTVADATTTRPPEETPSTQPDDTEVITLLGYKIPKQIALFLGLGLLILIIALILPLLLFFAWRKNDSKTVKKTTTTTDKTPPSTGSSTASETTTTETTTTNNYGYSSDYNPGVTPYVVMPSSTEPAYTDTSVATPPTVSTSTTETTSYTTPTVAESTELTTTEASTPALATSTPSYSAPDYSQITGESAVITPDTTTPPATDTSTTSTTDSTSTWSEQKTDTTTPSTTVTPEVPLTAPPSADEVPVNATTTPSQAPGTSVGSSIQQTDAPAISPEPPVTSEEPQTVEVPLDKPTGSLSEPSAEPAIEQATKPTEPPPAKPEKPTEQKPNHPNVPHLLNPAEELSVPNQKSSST